MPAELPIGVAAPADGGLPPAALANLTGRPLGIYLHVPFCRTRCGYCDFNTYTPAELQSTGGIGAIGASFLAAATAEIELAGRVLGPARPPVATVFLGGGTPTLLPPAELAGLLRQVEQTFGLVAAAEITTEANPESVTPDSLAQLGKAGFNRISFGMQSAVSHVLTTLDRVHSPGRPLAAVREARAAGLEQVSLDLIYGTPGESLADWQQSVEVALSAEPDHVSAYALVVETGTKLAVRVRRGELPAPDDDDLADKYLLAEELLTAAGYRAYEVSNWARNSAAECRHNLGYWRSDNWWGIGPGAHSHVGGVRWWNVKHPHQYANRLAAGNSPAHGRELLTAEQQQAEAVLLEIRLDEGMPVDRLSLRGRARIAELGERGLVTVAGNRLRLTLTGRLLADAVVRELLD